MAITFVGADGDSVAANPGTCAVGDLLVAMWAVFNGSDASVTFSDGVNTGPWIIPPNLHVFNATRGIVMQGAYIVCDHAGAPAVAFSSSAGGQIGAGLWTGFAHTPTLVAADTTTASGATGTPNASFVNSDANELSIGWSLFGAGNASAIGGSFTGRNGVGSGQPHQAFGDALTGSVGSTVSLTITTTSTDWCAQIMSFIDAAPSGGSIRRRNESASGGMRELSGGMSAAGIVVPERRIFLPTYAREHRASL